MNALEHMERIAAQRASAPVGSLRATMYSREGVDATDDAIRRGLRAFAVERSVSNRGRDTGIVFGTCVSDALRRASAPARLGFACYGDETRALRIEGDWDEPVVWPFQGVSV